MKNAEAANKTNIVLIGMPGSGKSTVGIILAKLTGMDFIDTDVLIQLSQNRSLQDIIDSQGHLALRKIEEDSLLNLHCRNSVVATGGSAAYGAKGMLHLKNSGIVVFLNAAPMALESRIRNFETRGLAKRADQTFSDLFEERFPLYKKYADIAIECSNMTQEEACETIIEKLHRRKLQQNPNTPRR